MDVLLDEIESLEAILMDDVNITKNLETGFPELIETTVFPTVGEDIDRQYICVTLQVIPSIDYPNVSPEFQLHKPRGLDDKRLNEIKDACMKKLFESVGEPVVFDLIDVIREHLTGSNLPCGQCVICLYGFQEGDEFTKTECYHYLHSYCLARHLTASKRNYQEEQEKLPAWQRKLSKPFQAVCPVCREAISNDVDNIKNSGPPKDFERAPEFRLTEELKDLQSKMSHLYLRQKSRGGIIDLDAEESNVISLEPDGHVNDERKSVTETIDVVTTENGVERSTVSSQSNSQSHRQAIRANHNHRGSSNRTNNTNCTPSSVQSQRQSSNNNYSHHHHRRHYNRGRRYHNHHHYTNQQQESSQAAQKTSNANDPSGSNSR